MREPMTPKQKQQFVQYYKDELSIIKAVRRLGINEHRYRKSLRADDEFRDQIEEATQYVRAELHRKTLSLADYSKWKPDLTNPVFSGWGFV